MKKCKIVALLLALIMLATMVPMALADDERPTLTVLRIGTDRHWVPDTSNNQKVMEILGVNLEVECVDAETMTRRFSSGDLADIITLSNFTFSEYADSGYLLPLNDLYEKYGNQRKLNTTQYALDLCTINGELLALPYENNNVKYFTQIRKDWLDNLGYDYSNWEMLENTDIYNISLETYEQILRDFTFKDPDGNGKDDTFGLSWYDNASIANCFMAFYGAFGGVMTQYYVVDDKLYPFEIMPEYRQALEEIHKLWDEGVIDKEIYILKKDQARANLMAGKSGSFNSWWSTAFELIRDGMWDLQPTTSWLTASIVGPDGKVGMKDNGRISSTVSITTQCKDPELAMQVLDKIDSDECWWLIRYGVEGEHYTRKENGEFEARTELGNSVFSALHLDALYPLTNRIDIENEINSIMPTDEKMIIRRNMAVHQFITWAPLYSSATYGLANPQENMDYGVDVKNCVEKWNMEFVTGQTELNDANWEAYLNAWKTAGGSDILAAYVAEYNAKTGESVTPGM